MSPTPDEPLDLSIIIPAYNEAERIVPTLERVLAWLDTRQLRAEVLVVDDGSSDDTAARVRQIAVADTRLELVGGLPNRGKGHAVGLGMAAARGELVVFTDADLSMPIEGFDRLRDALDAQRADIAIASRALPGASVDKAPPFHRRAMGRVFNAVVRATVLPGIKDTQCGFKLFRREVAQAVFARRTLDNFAFDVEVLYLARRLGYRIVEVPIHWSHDHASRILPLRDSLKMFWTVVQIPRTHRELGSRRGA